MSLLPVCGGARGCYTLTVPAPLLDSIRPTLRAAAEAFVPEIGAADPAAWNRLEEILAGALGRRPPALRRQLLFFVRVLDLLALARHGRRLAGVPLDRRTALLERLAGSPVLLLRRGVWGLRTLVQMGWYGQADVQAALGYRATPAGWEAR